MPRKNKKEQPNMFQNNTPYMWNQFNPMNQNMFYNPFGSNQEDNPQYKLQKDLSEVAYLKQMIQHKRQNRQSGEFDFNDIFDLMNVVSMMNHPSYRQNSEGNPLLSIAFTQEMFLLAANSMSPHERKRILRNTFADIMRGIFTSMIDGLLKSVKMISHKSSKSDLF